MKTALFIISAIILLSSAIAFCVMLYREYANAIQYGSSVGVAAGMH